MQQSRPATMWKRHSISTLVLVPLALAVVVAGLGLGCGQGGTDAEKGATPSADTGDEVVSDAVTTVSCSSDTTNVPLDLNCAALPNTSAHGQWVDQSGTVLSPQPSNGQTDTSAYLDYDLWAWNSFIALNWPAVVPSSSNGYQRGFPDQSKSFVSASSTDLTVWETFKEKREVFLYDYMTKTPSSEVPQAWNAEPMYGPSNAQVPDCPGTTTDVDFERHLGTASETRRVYYDTLDETAEVASEARETQAALCEGWVDPATQCGIVGANTCCTLNGEAVGPRVWQGDPHTDSGAKPVLYEVKVNYDFYKYVVDDNTYYLVNDARTAASNGEIHLPARTSSSAMPPGPGQHPGTNSSGPNPGPTGYSATSCLGVTTGTPCLQGSVHLKAGWVDISDLSSTDQAKYHSAEVLHYVSNSSVTGGICKEQSTYGLVGLHIIQRIHQYEEGMESNSEPPKGGTFVFATWEHTENDSAGFTYANYSGAPPTGSATDLQPYPNIANASALPLNRVYPILDSTARANTLVHGALSCSTSNSVWCNYELVGTQYVATSTPSPEPTQLDTLTPQSANVEAPANSGQPYYLANLVIESNVGLQQFQGLPATTDPNVITVIPHYQASNSTTPGNVTSMFTTDFQRTADNLAYRTQKGGGHTTYEYNMGGCMGCHGVAQLSGYAFSFVLLDNQYGGAPDTLTDFTIPPIADNP